MTSQEGGCDVADFGLCTTPAMFMVSRVTAGLADCANVADVGKFSARGQITI